MLHNTHLTSLNYNQVLMKIPCEYFCYDKFISADLKKYNPAIGNTILTSSY